MSKLSRRGVVKLAAGMAIGAGVASAAAAQVEAPKDQDLAAALQSPQGYMLIGPETFKIKGDGASRDLMITSALDVNGRNFPMAIRSSSLRIFRPDTSVDEFTKSGGLYWKFHQQQGKVKLKHPGEIVMVVRENDDTVRCFVLLPDERC